MYQACEANMGFMWITLLLLLLSKVNISSETVKSWSPMGNGTESAETGPLEMTSEPKGTELDELANFLTELLIEDPWKTVGDPLVYVSEPAEDMPLPWKRSRYYRRYPWKRQNGRNYDPDGFICNPSKDDVFQLLVALHESKGGKDRTVHFCNRRRPARAIFTNIRFLGRRK